MSEHEGSQPEEYQFKIYPNPTPLTEMAQNGSSAELMPPVQPLSMAYPPQPAPAPLPYYPAPGPGYPAVSSPAPAAQGAYTLKKQLYFPLTRNASAGKQFGIITLYSILMLALFAGSNFFLNLTPSDPAPGVLFAHPDGTIDGLQVLVFVLFMFLILPATFLLSGALFGARRAFLINCIVAGGTAGLWFMYAVTHHLSTTIGSGDILADIGVILYPITAALVGFCYDRRRYAAWWKSFLTMLAGAAVFVTVIIIALTILVGLPANATSQVGLIGFFAVVGCVWMLFIPLMALPVAGIEGVIHAILVARRGQRKPGP